MIPDRIPPRVDTPVDVTFGGTPDVSAPVTLFIDGMGGGNGSATINGSPSGSFALSGTVTVKLRGVSQTDPGYAGHLKLTARQRGTLLAVSKGFSVSSIPQNLSFKFNRLVTDSDCSRLKLGAGCGDRGILIDYAWDSDSTVLADLDEAMQSERIQLTDPTGFILAEFKKGCYVSSILPQQDFHDLAFVGQGDTGKLIMSQTFMFEDNRTGASEIPMTNSGFLVAHVVTRKPGSGLEVTTTKGGNLTIATDPNEKCHPGITIASAAGTGFTTKTQDV
jgi:hypothetical protein